jgi:hypothetical protein
MVMTDEEQTKLVAALQNPEHDRFPLRTARDAAVEIERMAEELQFQYACDKAQQEKIQNLSVEVEQLAARLAALERM